MQYDGGCSVQRRHNISTEEAVQCRSVTRSVERRHITSTDEGVQYGSVTLSKLTRVCNTGLPKVLRGGGVIDGCTCLGE